MASTDTTLAAYAVTVDADDLEVIIYRNPADPYIPPQEQDEVAHSAPQAEGYDPDAVLADLGYTRTGEWTLTDWGAVCDVVADSADCADQVAIPWEATEIELDPSGKYKGGWLWQVGDREATEIELDPSGEKREYTFKNETLGIDAIVIPVQGGWLWQVGDRDSVWEEGTAATSAAARSAAEEFLTTVM